MKLIHHIWLTVYSKPEDNEEKVLNSMNRFIPFDKQKEKVVVSRKSAEGFDERKIVIFQIHLEKQRHIRAFFENMLSKLSDGQKRMILRQKESRLDDNLHFFLRFDKTKLIEEKLFHITDEGNCYHIKISIAAFPTTREKALDIINGLFS